MIRFLFRPFIPIFRFLAHRVNVREREFQAIVLDYLGDGIETGRSIRKELGRRGQKMSLISFYSRMEAMERNYSIIGWYQDRKINGITIKERHYKINK